MADWNLPTLSSTYTNFLTELDNRLDDLALGNDPAYRTLSNTPTNTIRWTSASNRWEKYNGTAWVALTATYSINAATASAWATGRTVALTGDITGTSAAWTGSANLSFATTLATVNSNVGQYGSASAVPVITVNAKGLVTAVSTASLASMATQASTSVSITGGSISGTTLTLPSGTGSTTEGVIQWDATNNILKVGTGTATKTVTDLDTSQSLSNKTLSTGCTWNGNDIAYSYLAQGSALSVLGVTGNATADLASIAAGTDGHVLRRSGTALAFGTVATAGIADDAVTYAKIQNVSAADKILGRVTAGAGNIEEITCTTFGRSLLDDADAATARTTLGAQATLTSGTTLKTVGGVNLLGSGDAGVLGIRAAAYTTPGTYSFTVPEGVKYLKVHVIAGGGSGGGATTGGRAGGGGGGGGRGLAYLTVNPGEVYTITVGAGGIGSTGTGTAGGASSFGALATASGGGAGTGDVASGGAGAGGSTTGTTFSETVLRLYGAGVDTAGYYVSGGGGGSTLFGWPGTGGLARAVASGSGLSEAGANGASYGGGGSGATTTGADVSGGNGAGGMVLIEY